MQRIVVPSVLADSDAAEHTLLVCSDQSGRVGDEGTISWHKQQPTWPTTFRALTADGVRLDTALRQLVDAVKHAAGDRPVLWYSRPSAFDGAVLLDLSRWSSDFRDAEAQLGGPARVPLHRRVRCMRTLQHDASLVSGAPMLWRKADVPHDPRSDVMADAVSAHECLRVLQEQRWSRLVDDAPSDRSGAIPEPRPPRGMSWAGVQEYSIEPDTAVTRERAEQTGAEGRLPLSVQILAGAVTHGQLVQIVNTLQECVAGRRQGGRDDIIGVLREAQHEVDATIHAAWQHCAPVTTRPNHVRIELSIGARDESVRLDVCVPLDEQVAMSLYLVRVFPSSVCCVVSPGKAGA